MTTANAETIEARRRIALAAGAALLAAGLVLVMFVLPAEYGVDPLGIGKRLGLLPLGIVGQQVGALNAAAASGKASQGAIIVAQERPFQTETVDFKVAPHGSMEYKYRLDKGEALLYSWSATAPVNYELHAEPDGAPRGYAQSYEKRPSTNEASGTLTAPFPGIHGWYWENSGGREVTVTLKTAGFYNISHEFRRDAPVKTKVFQSPQEADAAKPDAAKPGAGLRSFVVEPMTSPAGANSSDPQLTTLKDHTVLSWIESPGGGGLGGAGGALKFSERTSAGWTDAQTVVSSERLIVNSADVPSVRRVSDGALVAHWTQQNGPDPEASTLRLSWSKDDGRTWSAPVSPYADKSQTQHGFASLFDVPSGGFGVVWLDGRAPNEDMALRARVYARDGKPGAEMIVDRRVCECCETATTQTAEGAVVAFRSRSAENVRDIYVSRLTGDNWTGPVLVHKDGWKIDGCPINGPSVSASGTNVAVAWFAAPMEQAHSFAAFSRDGGRSFSAPIRIDDASSLGRMQMALLPEGSAAVSWIEFADHAAQFRVRRVEQAGGRSAAVTIAAGAGEQHPRIAHAGGELTFAWTENKQGTQVHTARARTN